MFQTSDVLKRSFNTFPCRRKIRLFLYLPVNRPGQPNKQQWPKKVVDEDFAISVQLH